MKWMLNPDQLKDLSRYGPIGTESIVLQYVNHDGRSKMKIVSIAACNRVASHVNLKKAEGALYIQKLVTGHNTYAKYRGGIINEEAHHH